MLFNDSWRTCEIGEFEIWWECRICKVVFFNYFQEHNNTLRFYLCQVIINSCTLSASSPEKLLQFLTWNCCLIEVLKIDLKIDLSYAAITKMKLPLSWQHVYRMNAIITLLFWHASAVFQPQDFFTNTNECGKTASISKLVFQ